MVPIAVAERVLDRALNVPDDLDRINQSLAGWGLPKFYLGGTSFNTQYRIANKPRYVWRWFPPGMKLSQFYLYYMPNIEPGTEPQPSDEIVISL